MTSLIGTLDDAEAVAASVLSGIDALRDAELWRLGKDDLLAAGQLVESMARSLYAAQIRWVGEVENAAIADQLSISSTKVLLRDVLRIAPGDASDRVRAARRVLDREPISGGALPADLPIVAKAMDAGDVGAGHVAVITKAVSAWPAELDPQTRSLAEQLLVDQARQVDPSQLIKVAQQLEQILDPDGDEPDERDTTRAMELKVGSRNPRTGLTPIAGTLNDEAVEIFKQATDPLAAPAPEVDGINDTRSPANRLACGLVEALRRYLDAGTGPSVGGQVPHVTLTLDYDALNKLISNAQLDFGGPLPAGQARRILCDAQILPVVLGGDSQILDVGRAQRLFPPHLRKALTLRDGGCAWPGCDRPPGWCQAHHIKFWLDGGETSLENGTLLCVYHHQRAHQGEWTIQMADDGRPDFIPPPHLDPQQRPRRNHRHTPVPRPTPPRRRQ